MDTAAAAATVTETVAQTGGDLALRAGSEVGNFTVLTLLVLAALAGGAMILAIRRAGRSDPAVLDKLEAIEQRMAENAADRQRFQTESREDVNTIHRRIDAMQSDFARADRVDSLERHLAQSLDELTRTVTAVLSGGARRLDGE